MKFLTCPLLILALMLSGTLQAQVQYGTIDYVRTTEMNLEIEGFEENKQMKEMMSKMAAAGAFTQNYKATFAPEGFTFVRQVKPKTSMEAELGGGQVVMIETGGEDPSHYHTDVETGKVVNKDHIFGKAFLIEGAEAPLEWTETGETVVPSEATIGLELKLATAITPAGDTITAGYAPALPVQVGPLNYYGLPGAIITLNIPSGKEAYVYRATAMSVSDESLPLVKPTEGKKVTPAKFRAERAKREGMMKRQYNGNGE